MTCPCCGSEFPWEAGLVEADAKRLGAVLGTMDPTLARSVMSYLRLFKPPKTALRLTRALKLLQELAALVETGTVCRDERSGISRPAPVAVWIAGIDQMLQQSDRLTLPLGSHGYLREVVFGLADKADAVAERQREQVLRDGDRTAPRRTSMVKDDALTNELKFIAQMYSYGQLTEAERDQKARDAHARLGGAA